jgi:hypothetical protein
MSSSFNAGALLGGLRDVRFDKLAAIRGIAGPRILLAFPFRTPDYLPIMKAISRVLGLGLLAALLSSCLFKEPVFTEGFAKVDPALAGVWASEGKNQDPRKMEFAVLAPVDDSRFFLHQPAGEKGGLYYEVRQLNLRERIVLQLRVLATFSDGIPNPDDSCYTLLWIEKMAGGKEVRVRVLGGDGVKNKGPVEVRKFLEDPSADWKAAFGDSQVFRRLEEK